MSAKSDDLRPLFRDLPSVVEFVGKPFTPSEISFLVADVLARAHPGAGRPEVRGDESAECTPSAVSFSYAQKEAAAKAMFTQLRDRFARIPEWMRSLGDGAPAPYFAQEDPHPGAPGRPPEARSSPTLRDVIAAEPGPSRSGANSSGSALLQGQTSILPLPHLLRELAASGRTGQLRLDHGTPHLPALHPAGPDRAGHPRPTPTSTRASSSEDLSAVPAADLDRARGRAARQCRQAPVRDPAPRPRDFPRQQLPRVLYQHGKRGLLEAIEAGPAPFEWLEPEELPAYVEAYGRQFSLEQLHARAAARGGRLGAGRAARGPRSTWSSGAADGFGERLRQLRAHRQRAARADPGGRPQHRPPDHRAQRPAAPSRCSTCCSARAGRPDPPRRGRRGERVRRARTAGRWPSSSPTSRACASPWPACWRRRARPVAPGRRADPRRHHALAAFSERPRVLILNVTVRLRRAWPPRSASGRRWRSPTCRWWRCSTRGGRPRGRDLARGRVRRRAREAVPVRRASSGSSPRRPPEETVPTVLVVDDVQTDRELIGKVVTSAGHHPEYAEDGDEAVEKAKALKPRAHPARRGDAQAGRLRDLPQAQEGPGHRRHPGGAGDLQEHRHRQVLGREAGRGRPPGKPFTPDELAEVLRKFL